MATPKNQSLQWANGVNPDKASPLKGSSGGGGATLLVGSENQHFWLSTMPYASIYSMIYKC